MEPSDRRPKVIFCVSGGRRSLLHTTCVCPYCNKMISNKYNLKTHIVDKHTVQTERFICDLCNRVYSTKHSLATHTSTVHRGEKYVHHNTQDGFYSSTSLRPPQRQIINHSNSETSDQGDSKLMTNSSSVSRNLKAPSHIPKQKDPSSLEQFSGIIHKGIRDNFASTQPSESNASLAELAAQLLPAEPLEGGPTFEQMQSIAISINQNFPRGSFTSFSEDNI